MRNLTNPLALATLAITPSIIGCSHPAAASQRVTPIAAQGQLLLPPGQGLGGMEVIGTVRPDSGNPVDEWVVLDNTGAFAHTFQGELIGLRVTTGIEAIITTYDANDFPTPDTSGRIDLGVIDTRDKVVEHTLNLQPDEGHTPTPIRIAMWFGIPPQGVALGSRQFPIIESGTTIRWLLPPNATDIYFLVEHPQDPKATSRSWRGKSQQRFGPYTTKTLPTTLPSRPD